MTTQLTHGEARISTTGQATQAGHGRLLAACHRIHAVIQEMNYGARRVVEAQAPWTVDKQWDRK